MKRIDISTLEQSNLEEDIVNIITMKWGIKYDSEYVNKLYRGVVRNTTKKFNFICFTDCSEGLNSNIEVREISEDWKCLLCKSTIFADFHNFKGLNFFIDLDMIITGNLDDIFSYTGKFALMRTDEI